MHAKSGLRVDLKMEDLSSGLSGLVDRCRYPAQNQCDFEAGICLFKAST